MVSKKEMAELIQKTAKITPEKATRITDKTIFEINQLGRKVTPQEFSTILKKNFAAEIPPPKPSGLPLTTAIKPPEVPIPKKDLTPLQSFRKRIRKGEA